MSKSILKELEEQHALAVEFHELMIVAKNSSHAVQARCLTEVRPLFFDIGLSTEESIECYKKAIPLLKEIIEEGKQS